MLEIDLNHLPRHVAVIMDGNGRWARQRLKTRIHGHQQGAESVREIVRCCRKLGIPYLTLYAFSKENWNRPEREIRALWGLLERFLKSELPELIEKEIRFCHIGDIEGVPGSVLKSLRLAGEKTASFDKLVLSLAINYGGRQEIVRAAKMMLADVLKGPLAINQISPEVLSTYLHTAGYPDPDLVIRTGGEIRVSNFLLWQIAYAELYFTEVLWPDFRESNLLEAIKDFQSRERRFGRTGEQIRTQNAALT
jgi:undecaprenyl diphosphate synthase